MPIVELVGSSQINTRNVSIPVVNCSFIKWSEQAEARLTEFKLNKRAFFCLNFNANNFLRKKINLEQLWVIWTRSLVIRVSKCDEKSPYGLQRVFEKDWSYFHFRSVRSKLPNDFSDYFKPITYTSSSINPTLSDNLLIEHVVLMEYYELLTDVGWLMETIEADKFFTRGKTSLF